MNTETNGCNKTNMVDSNAALIWVQVAQYAIVSMPDDNNLLIFLGIVDWMDVCRDENIHTKKLKAVTASAISIPKHLESSAK